MVVCLVATLGVTAANLRLTYVTDSHGARQVVLTSESDPARVMSLSGIEAEEGDEVYYTAFAGSLASLNIERAFSVTIEAEGQEYPVKMVVGTVADALERAGITLEGDDYTEPALSAMVTAGSKIEVHRVEYQDKVETQAVPYDTEYVYTSLYFRNTNRATTLQHGSEGQQTVTTRDGETLHLNGLYIGESRAPFEKACELAQELNIVHVERRAKKVVTYLDPEELKTTWVGNKGVYRTRMIVADGGDLIILAPGVRAFGENEEMDAMTRKFGYKGRDYILDLFNKGAFGDDKIMSAAHLIQGSSDGRFTITYCTKPELMSKEEIESVGYQWADYNEVSKRYDPHTLKEGWNTMPDGEEIYFVGTPALGLWKCDD